MTETTNMPAPRHRGDEAILAALAAGHTYDEAATLAKVSRRTVERRMADPLFRAQLDDAKRIVVQQTAASLAQASASAIAKLEALLQHRDPWVQFKSATALVEFSIRVRESEGYEDRLAALEERARELQAAAVIG